MRPLSNCCGKSEETQWPGDARLIRQTDATRPRPRARLRLGVVQALASRPGASAESARRLAFMVSAPLSLKTNVVPSQAVDRLNEMVKRGDAVPPVGVGGAQAIIRMRSEYLAWIEAVELCLRDLTVDPTLVDALFTSRHWRIRSIESDPQHVSDPRPYPLIEHEVRQQQELLRALIDDLQERIRRLSASGHITVLDANVLLHHQLPSQIPWPSVVGRPSVRLVVPLRVIEEIDAKKYAKASDLAQRARDLLPKLEGLLGGSGTRGALDAATTIEVPILAGPRYRPDDADEEILHTCRELAQFCGGPVTLVTGDTAMRLRAQAESLIVVKPPDSYARVRGSARPAK
jgi:hypothetical protein